MDLKSHFQSFSEYNRCANDAIYSACAQLSDEGRKQDRQGFFKSIHNTLNHIIVGDRIWLNRFEGKPKPSFGLDTVLYSDFEELHAARCAEDQRIIQYFQQIDASYLTKELTYVNTSGQEYTSPFHVLAGHVFNHQTHHRGQVHHMLGMAGVHPPSLDMPRVLNT